MIYLFISTMLMAGLACYLGWRLRIEHHRYIWEEDRANFYEELYLDARRSLKGFPPSKMW